MENHPRFDLNAAIETWQQELAAQSNLTAEVRRELETHLRDAIADFQKRGSSEEESFVLARRAVGAPDKLGREFGKSAEQLQRVAAPFADFFRDWWHPLLVFSCNSALLFLFIPSRPALWMILTVVGLLFCFLNRFKGREIDFFRARSVSYALLVLAGVVAWTACFQLELFVTIAKAAATTFNAGAFGGRQYSELLLGIVLYFVLSSVRISRERAGLYMGLYFLSALAGLLVDLALGGWPIFFGMPAPAVHGVMAPAAGSVFCFLLAQYGARGTLDLAKPWRLLLMLLALAVCIYSGYRTQMIVVGLVFAVLFCMEGLFRTRHFVTVLAASALALAVLVPNLRHLPFPVREALSFLPVEDDSLVRHHSEVTQKLRVEAWKQVLPTIPRYLLVGRGYGVAPGDGNLKGQHAEQGRFGPYDSYAPSMLTTFSMFLGYRNGPLSVIIPFGIPGAIVFLWFLTAAGIVLHRNYSRGAPDLRGINRLLLVVFWVRVFGFVFVFGALQMDMAFFCGLLGLSVSLNAGAAPRTELADAKSPAPVAGPSPGLLQENLSARLV